VRPHEVHVHAVRRPRQAQLVAVRAPGPHRPRTAQGARAIGSSREEFAAFMRAEQEKWGKVLTEIKIKPE